MKKTKRILLSVSTVIVAVIMCIAVGCGCKKKPKPVDDGPKTLQSIELDTSNAKIDFIAEKDEFTSEGLVIKATYLKNKETVTENLTPSSTGVQVDSAAFNKNVAGVYSISVFYTYERVFKSAEYNVNVIVGRAGLDVQLKKGQSDKITATTGGTDISAAASWIEVRQPDKFGKVDDNSAPLAASAYTVSVYKDETKVENLTNVKAGAYQIWASVTDGDGNELEGFVIVYVLDVLSELEFKSGTTQQSVGADVISDTWKFTATYVTGETKELSKSDVTIQGFSTNAPTENGEAIVSYSYNGVTKSVTVNYKIINPTGEVTYNLTYASNGSTGMVTTWDGLQGATGQITFGGTASTYKQSEKFTQSGTRFVNLVEIKSGKTITLTFGNTVKAGSVNITIYVSHNNTTETRTAQIVKSGDSTITDSIAVSPDNGAKAPYVVSFGLTGQSAGTYTIDATGTMNLYAIEISYTVDYGN